MQRMFANALKHFRKEKGLTQAVVAKRAGMAQSEISRLEGGYHWPSYETIVKLIIAMEIEGEPFGRFIADDIDRWKPPVWNSFQEDIDNYKKEQNKNGRNKHYRRRSHKA